MAVVAVRTLSLPVLWVIVGVVVAAVYDYFETLGTSAKVLTAVAAVLLWPMLPFGFDVKVTR